MLFASCGSINSNDRAAKRGQVETESLEESGGRERSWRKRVNVQTEQKACGEKKVDV